MTHSTSFAGKSIFIAQHTETALVLSFTFITGRGGREGERVKLTPCTNKILNVLHAGPHCTYTELNGAEGRECSPPQSLEIIGCIPVPEVSP